MNKQMLVFSSFLIVINVYGAESAVNISTQTSSVAPQGKRIKVIEIPDSVDVVNIFPYNNNSQYIEFRTDTGQIIKQDPSWKKEIVVTDPTLIKYLSHEQTPYSTKESTVAVVNNNDHVIIQNNSQAQTTVPVIQKREEAPAPSTITTNTVPSTSWYTLAASAFMSSKGAIIIGSVGVCWLGLLSKLLYTSYSISSYNGWGIWHNDTAIESIPHADQAILSQHLFTDIQKKYLEKNGNFLSPLIHFMNDADAEIAYLKQFLQIHQTLSTIKLSILFPKQLETQDVALQRIGRLEFLKNLVITFAAEYKVA